MASFLQTRHLPKGRCSLYANTAMNILVFALSLTAVGCEAGLTTSYVQKLRAEIALADHLVLRTSPENGGASRSTNDVSELRTIAKLIPKEAAVVPSPGSLSSTEYATIAVYEAHDSQSPSLEITVMPDRCAFSVNDKVYVFKTTDRSLYDAVMQAATQRE